MNEELRRIIERVEQLDPVVQDAIIKEFQRIVERLTNMSPREVTLWDEQQFESFTKHARMVLHLAKEEARGLSARAVGPEHLLLGLVREGEGVAARVLKQLGAGVDDLDRLVAWVFKPDPMRGLGRVATPGDSPVEGELPWTARAKRTFALAKEEAQRLKDEHIGTEHLLLGLLQDEDNLGAGMLAMLGIDLAEARRQTLRAIGKGE
ncbi:Clp protease N-terminal domain-containing protein [Thermogemmatispora sp.]|uniref:Clp protease N-terminal domain-containing protein n=1 Tax=Thermogemmatispora sp. TaxID=1968838 RepID=UPI001D2FDDCA|nr:Clp protease N-terminal domain-containing protein [Thermogemmatispora sp.]MBX5450417.1 hypothetical protein [Thermogemmatispora sp.]